MKIVTGAVTAVRRIVDLALIGIIVVVLFGLMLGKIVPLTGHQTIIIGGGSMEPSIGLGSAIVIGPIRPDDLVVGDVVSLQIGADRATFTHRITTIVQRADGIWVRTKGDSNADPDPTLVPATAILGRVEWTIPFAGYLLALLSVPVGVIFVLGLAATLLAIAWLLESVESDTERVVDVSDVASTLAGGEPIAARGPNPAFPPPTLPLRTIATAGPAGIHAAIPPFAAIARPTSPERLARIHEVRALRLRWLGDHSTARPLGHPDGD
jgi:signal peptidase